MKFTIDISKENIFTLMRKCGYAPEGRDATTNELKFHRMLRGRRYPKFHLYCKVFPQENRAVLNVHIDQKQPSYNEAPAHSGEYTGPILEAEVKRIQEILKM